MFDFIPTPWKIAGACALALLLIGIGGWLYLEGRSDGHNADAAANLKETEHGIEIRDKADRNARGLDDRSSFERLRPGR